ncbi:MAG: flagellin, partial [Oscillospiraceae bacterium]
MIIQHNIMALNSYNRLGTNNGLIGKNLEKLSSGYKINRAGDDAAGLAISEKMRAQITGLTRATQNSQDGVSLVQTAEGNLTEVHSMLNRMVDLATQSSNGTIDDSVDRANLQKEVTSLKAEINRIAESSHFNGIKLLDGSLGASAKATAGATGSAANIAFDFSKMTNNFEAGATFTVTGAKADGTKGTHTFTFAKEAVALVEGATSSTIALGADLQASLDSLVTAINAVGGAKQSLNGITSQGATATTKTLTIANAANGTHAGPKMTMSNIGLNLQIGDTAN